MNVVGIIWNPPCLKWVCITVLSGGCPAAARRQDWQCGCRQRRSVVRGDRCIIMNAVPPHRVKAGAAVDYQVIKCTVAGPIIDIVIIAFVVIIKWPLRCVDFCGFGVDNHKSDGAAQPWHLLQCILPVFHEMLT